MAEMVYTFFFSIYQKEGPKWLLAVFSKYAKKNCIHSSESFFLSKLNDCWSYCSSFYLFFIRQQITVHTVTLQMWINHPVMYVYIIIYHKCLFWVCNTESLILYIENRQVGTFKKLSEKFNAKSLHLFRWLV